MCVLGDFLFLVQNDSFLFLTMTEIFAMMYHDSIRLLLLFILVLCWESRIDG